MYEIRQGEPSQGFRAAWSAAARHLQRQAGEGLSWLRSDLNPPIAEHLAFRMGNQLFFIFVDAANVEAPSTLSFFKQVSREATAVPCVISMRLRGGEWVPSDPGWALIHAETCAAVIPPALVSEELIEMSPWEVHDFAINVVVESLLNDGKKVFARQSSLHIDPSIWFEDAGQAHFVVIREARYPQSSAERPANTPQIVASCSRESDSGFFASVAIANGDDVERPLCRGHGMLVVFRGLIAI